MDNEEMEREIKKLKRGQTTIWVMLLAGAISDVIIAVNLRSQFSEISNLFSLIFQFLAQ